MEGERKVGKDRLNQPIWLIDFILFQYMAAIFQQNFQESLGNIFMNGFLSYFYCIVPVYKYMGDGHKSGTKNSEIF